MSAILALVTRPEPACSELAARLVDGGLTALPMPAFSFRAMTPEPSFADAWSSARRRLAVFTSPRAVAFGLRALAPEQLAGATVAAVGPATARALEERGLAVLTPPAGGYTSEALLEHPALSPEVDGAALIFAAPGGRRVLPDRLGERGWSVTMALVYERVAQAPKEDDARRLGEARRVISIWTSGAAMQQLLETLPGDAWTKILAGVFIVISRRLARLARDLGASDVRLAEGPDNDSLARCALAAGKQP